MKKLIILLLSFTFASGVIFSQTADDILAKYLKNSGGVEKLKSLKTIKFVGKMPTPQGDLQFSIFKKAPNKSLTEINIQGMKIIPQAYDGEIAWYINPMMGSDKPQKLTDDMAKTIKDQSDFEDPFIDYSKKGHTVSYEGKENVNGTECFKIILIKNKNNEEEDLTQIYFFDTEYYMPILVKSTIGGSEVETYLSNYSEIDGFSMPMNLEVKAPGQPSQKITFDNIEINSELSDDIFKFKE